MSFPELPQEELPPTIPGWEEQPSTTNLTDIPEDTSVIEGQGEAADLGIPA